MFAQTIVPVKIIDHESIPPGPDALAHPRLEHGAPVGVVQARPVFLHAADGVAVVDARCAVGVFFQKVQWVFHRLGAELFLVPQFVVKFEKAARAIFARRFAHEKLDVEMADDEHVELVQIAVALDEPRAIFREAHFRKVCGIAAAVFRVREAPIMAAVKTHLRQLRPRLLDEGQIIRVRVVRPVGDHGGELERALGGALAGADGEQERKNEQNFFHATCGLAGESGTIRANRQPSLASKKI